MRPSFNKTLLSLGGSAQQVVALETARRLGLRTVLCDYLPDNPGQFHADKFYPKKSSCLHDTHKM